jgi:hypothetical protein
VPLPEPASSENNPQALPLRAAYAFGSAHGIESEVAKIRDLDIEWDSYTSSLRRGYIVELFEKLGLFEDFKKEYWPVGNTPVGERNRRRYLRIKAQYVAFLEGRGPEPDAADTDETQSEANALQFAVEAHLRDFLAKNLGLIEPGLRLYSSPEHDGIEFPVDNGRIDLLAIDRDGKFVVIELKLSQGRNKALGQLLYYMGWVDQHLGHSPCRGFIIGSDVADELAVAVARVPGVSLAKYRMNFAIETIRSEVGGFAPSEHKTF